MLSWFPSDILLLFNLSSNIPSHLSGDGDVALVILCSMFPRSTHETFAQKLYQTFKDHKRFSKPKLARTDFTINHYAGDVRSKTREILTEKKNQAHVFHRSMPCHE